MSSIVFGTSRPIMFSAEIVERAPPDHGPLESGKIMILIAQQGDFYLALLDSDVRPPWGKKKQL